ncbi:MAG: sialidase family protein [Candidatus Sumerlaeota bacterium]|nr:sialidase family protein [Candidatus Sumerlaeota bacterium]
MKTFTMNTAADSSSSEAHTRRAFLRRMGILAGMAGAGFALPERTAAPKASVIETKSISYQPEYYHGWPTLARRKNGDLLVTYSGGREAHVCPFGRVEMMVSHDQGATWGWPRVVMDSDIDDRDSGVMETARGSLLVTTFTSLAYAASLDKAAQKEPGSAGAWAPEKLKRWLAAHERLNAAQRKAELGQWMIRSTDGGVTWSARYPSIVNSPHGPIQLADGRLLYAGKELWTDEKRIGVCESKDDGQTWQWLAEIPTRSGDDKKIYHELHAVEASGGRLIAHIRNHNPTNGNEILQTESADGGKTWTAPHPIGVWGLPSFLLRLRNGKLLMTYGYRRAPFGNQARISEDEGKTWSDPMTISRDGAAGDLGYPSTVELDDGALLTVWYELPKGSSHAVLRQAQWRIEN